MRQCILIVDDDPDARDLLNRVLRAEGFDTAYAVDAYDALVAARRSQPDLILLDFRLPGGDGLVVLERLRKISTLAIVPVIVLSAVERVPFEERVLAAGATCFLQKPTSIPELVDAIHALLDVRGAGTLRLA
jgi:DNA-binding response OmpR family regulator